MFGFTIVRAGSPSAEGAPVLASRPRRRAGLALRFVALASVAGLTAFGGLQSLALFTSTAASNGNAFTAGTLVLGVTPASTSVTFSNMAPGDSTTGSLVLADTGSLNLRYAMTTSATATDGKGLASELTAVVKTLGTGPACSNWNGTDITSGTLAALAFGNPAQGAQGGDRTLGASSSETLCVKVTLPLAADNTFQGATTTATFTFAAEQTANN